MRNKSLGLAVLASATVMLGACAESTDGQAAAARPPVALYPGHRRTTGVRIRSHRNRVGWHLPRHPFR